MTQLTDRSTPLSSRLPARARRTPDAGETALGGVVAAALGLGAMTVPVLLIWIAAPYPDNGPSGALHVAAALWLAAHGVGLVRPDALSGAGAPIGLTPLLLAAVPVWLMYRAARYTVEARAERLGRYHSEEVEPPYLGPTIGWLAAGYLSVAVAALVYTSGGPLHPDLLGALLRLPLVAGGALGYGVWVASGRPRGPLPEVVREAADRVPERVRIFLTPARRDTALRGAAAGTALLLAGGALLLLMSLAWHGFVGEQPFLRLPEAWSGRCGMLLLGLVLVPNAVVWGAAYGLGPGFTLGAGSVAGPLGAAGYPSLPAFPLLAGLPEQGPGGPGTWWVAVVPVAAGLGVGWCTARAAVPPADADTPERTAGRAARLAAAPDRTTAAPVGGVSDPVGGLSALDGRAAALDGRAAASDDRGSASDDRVSDPDERREQTFRSVRETALTAALSSVGCLLATALLTGLADGPLGRRGLAAFGPSWWLTGPAALAWTLLVGTPTALLLRWWWIRERRRAPGAERWLRSRLHKLRPPAARLRARTGRARTLLRESRLYGLLRATGPGRRTGRATEADGTTESGATESRTTKSGATESGTTESRRTVGGAVTGEEGTPGPPAQRDRHGRGGHGHRGGTDGAPDPAVAGARPLRRRPDRPSLPGSRPSPAEECDDGRPSPADERDDARGSWLPLPRTGPAADPAPPSVGRTVSRSLWPPLPRRRRAADDPRSPAPGPRLPEARRGAGSGPEDGGSGRSAEIPDRPPRLRPPRHADHPPNGRSRSLWTRLRRTRGTPSAAGSEGPVEARPSESRPSESRPAEARRAEARRAEARRAEEPTEGPAHGPAEAPTHEPTDRPTD
ncbi:cell division protein PerM [Streptomyces sp. bgisy100]|uniref:cell division protein PerM n=1 Tax=Streptomyces sp. bgisy100 TaxID=3413783 RepID=UPI003D71290C